MSRIPFPLEQDGSFPATTKRYGKTKKNGQKNLMPLGALASSLATAARPAASASCRAAPRMIAFSNIPVSRRTCRINIHKIITRAFHLRRPPQGTMRYWLFKEEPEHYSYADLERDATTLWDGVTNNLARLNLRQV